MAVGRFENDAGYGIIERKKAPSVVLRNNGGRKGTH